jgi:nucleoside-diphosphate-sugar epimerase
VINLGTGVETTLRDVVAAVIDLTGSRSEIRWGAMAPRRWDTDRWVAEASQAERLLSWRPAYELRRGLVAMAAWMKEVGDDYGDGALRAAG